MSFLIQQPGGVDSADPFAFRSENSGRIHFLKLTARGKQGIITSEKNLLRSDRLNGYPVDTGFV